MGRKKLDLTGRRFGDLEALECSGASKKGSALWRCLCHRCGAECVVEGYRLTDTRQPKTNCGCKQRDRRADLSGRTLGGLDVIRRAGTDKSGSYLYLCRCRHCGRKITEPASTLRAATPPQSCGCIRYPAARMKALSDKGMDAALDRDKGTNLYVVTKTTPDANNLTTGYRWVRKTRKKGREYYHAVFFVCGKRYYKGGFASAESASEWAQEEHALALAAHGIQDPRK